MTKRTGKPVGRPPSAKTQLLRSIDEAVRKAVEAKQPMRPKARYDAGGNGRRMAGWNPRKSSPNTAIEQLEKIRERARDSSRNDWAAASLVQKWSTSLIGIGITPRWKLITSKTRKLAIVQLWQDWTKIADADNVLDFYGMQTMVVRTWFDGGECFARKRRRFPDSGLPVPLQVQLLESDMLPMLDADVRQDLPMGNVIRSGIEFDKRGQRIAYWFYKQHPGDRIVTYNGGELVRVAASEVCHIYEPKRPGQLRGVSESASILSRLRNIADYEDATLERQKLANLFVAFLKRTAPEFDPLVNDMDPLTGKPIENSTDIVDPTPLVGLQPGLFQTLDDGEEVQFSNPPEAGTTYSDYNRTMQLGTAAGGGIPYEMLAGDIANVSDRTLRVIINEFRRLAEQRQWQIVIPMFCQPVVEWFADAAAILGAVGLRELPLVKRVEHAPHGWTYIHPVQDPQGKQIEVNAGFRSLSSVISERGDDPDQVADETQADDKRQQDLKIGPYSEAAKAANAPKVQPKDAASAGSNPNPNAMLAMEVSEATETAWMTRMMELSRAA